VSSARASLGTLSLSKSWVLVSQCHDKNDRCTLCEECLRALAETHGLEAEAPCKIDNLPKLANVYDNIRQISLAPIRRSWRVRPASAKFTACGNAKLTSRVSDRSECTAIVQ
jgi:predicted Zn-ribbon and HTH transcriptional regulator